MVQLVQNVVLCLLIASKASSAFQASSVVPTTRCPSVGRSSSSSPSRQWAATSSSDDSKTSSSPKTKKDNKAMAFLKKMGKVGGAANKDFSFTIGLDEGPAGNTQGAGGKPLRKSKSAYQSCTESGVIDDMSETFPSTSSGTEWGGYTDQVMGGCSGGQATREEFEGRQANVLRGKVSLENNGGFIQMATNLALYTDANSVDASMYDGVELDVRCNAVGDSEKFNVHLKTDACPRPFSSYRASFEAPVGKWETVRLPFDTFKGHGPGATEAEFDTSTLRRAGIVAIGKEMDVELGVSGFRFYKNA